MFFAVSSSGWFRTNFSPIRGQVVPGSRHLQKLIAMLALGHLLGEHSAFFSVFSVFGCGFHD